jgi:hypothetical protein
MTSLSNDAGNGQGLDDDPIVYERANRGRGSNGASSAVSVIAGGGAISVYPSDEIDEHMREWGGVVAEFGSGATSGKIKTIRLTRADNGGGLKIRRYPSQRAKVNIKVAVEARVDGKRPCGGAIEEDGSVVIAVPTDVHLHS